MSSRVQSYLDKAAHCEARAAAATDRTIYAPPRRAWLAHPRELFDGEVIEAVPPYGWPAEPHRRW